MTTPRGIRNNNPGNIRYVEGITSTYRGCVGTDGAFCRFDTPHNGIRALGRLLLTYQSRHGLRTVNGIIHRWAPPSDNNDTAAYVHAVCNQMHVGQDEELELTRPQTLFDLTEAIIQHENGQNPYATEAISAAVLDALDQPFTAAAPQQPEEPAAQPVQEPTMEEQPSTSINWDSVMSFGSKVASAAGPVVSMFNPLVGALLTALPLVFQNKVATAVAKHTDPATGRMVATALSDAMMQTAKAVTGKADDMEAVVAARNSRAALVAVEQAATTKLEELAPFIEKAVALERMEQEASVASMDAAAERNAKAAWDMTERLVNAALAMAAFVLLFFAITAWLQLYINKKIETEVWAAITGAGGTVFGIMTTVFVYRFGSTVQSAVKNALIGTIAKARTGQQ